MIQRQLQSSIVTHNCLNEVRWLGGVDIGFESNGTVTRAAVVVLDATTLELCDHAIARLPTQFPYIPGLLSFREAPAALTALAQLRIKPDLLLCDGQGIAHPRRLGIAAHLGLAADIPSIGVAKSRLTGTYGEVPTQRFAWTPLYDNSEIIGAVLRTRVNVKPIFVSIGHRIDLATALSYVLRCTTKYRLPETTRWAHRMASSKL